MNNKAPLWRPSPESIADCNLSAFIAEVSKNHSGITDYDSLYQWSVESSEAFWAAVWDFCGIVSSRRWDSVLTNPDAMPGASWFSGARLNFAENLLKYRDKKTAIVFQGEGKNGESTNTRKLTYSQLYQEVVNCAELLKSLGVNQGDRVAGYMSNNPEAIVAMLATASLGAIWSSCSPDFGVKGVLERFAQIQPKILFAIDGYRYNGKEHDVLESVETVVSQIPSIEKVIVIPFLNSDPDVSNLSNSMLLRLRYMDN